MKNMKACASQTSILNQLKESFEINLSDSQKELTTNQTAYEDFKAAKTNEIKVHLFQHGDFSGWKVQFGIESFHLIENPQDYFDAEPRSSNHMLLSQVRSSASPIQ